MILGCTNNYSIQKFKTPHDSSQTYKSYIIKRPFGDVKIINASYSMFSAIKRDFYSAPLAAQFSVSKIRISHDQEDKDFKDGGGAHFHTDSKHMRIKFSGYIPHLILPSGEICINLEYCNGLLRHEMSHSQVYFWKIQLKEIGEISKWKYLYRFWELENKKEYPKNGFLYRYATKNEDEEAAGIVSAISNFFFNLQDPYTGAPHGFFGIDKKDDRYLKKVEAVHKLGLTTKLEHQKIIELFKEPR